MTRRYGALEAGTADAQPAAALIATGPFQGATYNSFYPPDPTIAAGPRNVVVAVNGTLNIFGRDGTLLGSQSLQNFFSALGSVANDGIGPVAPHAIYDQYINRFWLVAFTEDDSALRSTILLGISDTNDAAASWTIYSFDGGQDGGTASGFACDSPQIGVDAQAVYIASNQFDFSGNFQYAKVRIMTKDQFVNRGSGIHWWDFYKFQEGSSMSFGLAPAHMYGAAPADGEFLVDAHGQGGAGNALEVWRITNPQRCCVPGNQSSPDLTQSTQSVGDYDVPPNARQPGSSVAIDTGDAALLYAIWQNGLLSTGHTVAAPGGSAAAFAELDVSQYPSIATINDWVLTDVNTDYYYPAVDVVSTGDKVMVYGTSSATMFPEADFVIIPNSSSCTVCIGDGGILAAGASSYVLTSSDQRNLWGQYFGAAADPNGAGVWIHGEYAAATPNTWGTEVALVSVGPQVLEATTQTITAAGGGTLVLPSGSSVSIPPGVLRVDQNATLSLLSSLAQQPPSGLIAGIGPALRLSFTSTTASESPGADQTTFSLPASAAADMEFTINFSNSTAPGLDGSLGMTQLFLPQLSTLNISAVSLGAPAVLDLPAGKATVTIPAGVLDHFQVATSNSTATVDVGVVNWNPSLPPPTADRFGPRQWNPATNRWGPFPSPGFDPTKRTCVLVHGILSTVEGAFPDGSDPTKAAACDPVGKTGAVARIAARDRCDQVVGFNYAWWQPVSTSGMDLAQFLRTAGLKDVVAEGHSLGGDVLVSALAGIPDTQLKVEALATLGSPLTGTSAANNGENVVSVLGMLLPITNFNPFALSPSALAERPFASTLRDAVGYGFVAGVTTGNQTLANNLRTFASNHSNAQVIAVGGTGSVASQLVGTSLGQLFDGWVFQGNAADGVVDTSRARCDGCIFKNLAVATFPLTHIGLECDDRVVNFVGQNIAGGQALALTSLALSQSTVVGGTPLTGTVTLSAPAGSGGATVQLQSNNPAAQVPPSVQVPAGQTSASFAVTTSVVTAQTGGSISATLGSVVKTATLTVTPVPSSGTVTGTWKGEWTHNIFGFCSAETLSLTWKLTQSGASVTGDYQTVVTTVSNAVFCDPVGTTSNGSFVKGSVNGNVLDIFTEGGFEFTGTITATTISGTGGSSGQNGPFKVTKE